jgi:hypothetical protein
VIENSVSRLYNAVGAEGIAEKYGFVPEGEEQPEQTEEKSKGDLSEVTIDFDMQLPDEKTFENQHIYLRGNIVAKQRLVFHDCIIEPQGKGCISVLGTLEMERCRVLGPCGGFLKLGQLTHSEAVNHTINDTEFIFSDQNSHSDLPVIECQNNSANTLLEGCSFRVTDESTGPVSSNLLKGVTDVSKCSFANISGRIEAKRIRESLFTKCSFVSAESYWYADETRAEITDSTFVDCKDISLEGDDDARGTIKRCEFTRIASLSLTNADVADSSFKEIRKEENELISAENAEVTGCLFSDVQLEGDAYLMEGYESVSVSNCRFENCRTSRNDRQLFSGKAETGKVFKKMQSTSIVDEASCTGLDDVKVL